ncbi:XRE family transcriptional regulator [Porphyrobacter sp. TH134]|uniref:helix-turn-helix domain-containing protein n=1 Tax=Porphyrobacter sp. TH134 TaxID=2067450 RepID=UPI000C7C2068|nr:helix-turn-helix transcriptional regulator [Porphyrobacter sp. TH134]PLK22637.1 XRE family transcriptional regulator [Porphyrobacter sp. TH134]
MAIKAHLDDPRAGPSTGTGVGERANPRSAERRALRLETSGFAAGMAGGNVTIHNISAAGLLLETGLALEAGDEFALDLPQAGVVTAQVVWRSERLYGCAFRQTLGPAALAAAQLQGFAPGVPTEAVPAAPLLSAGEPLGPRLNRLRREAGLTLADVAAILNVSKPTVWAWEKGKARPLPERLDAIAAALGVDPAVLSASPGRARDIDAVIAECRQRIAEACGTSTDAVRIMVEL